MKVFARLRPLNPAAEALDDALPGTAGLQVLGATTLLVHTRPDESRGRHGAAEDFQFSFHHVFGPSDTQADVFAATAAPLVEDIFCGVNATVLAYGATNSGKTHAVNGGTHFATRGLVPRITAAIFRRSRELEAAGGSVRDMDGGAAPPSVAVSVSYMQIYNEELSDLLAKPGSGRMRILEGSNGDLHLQNLCTYHVRNEEDALALFFLGNASRLTAATHSNAHSSRSHSVFTLTVECRAGGRIRRGKLNLVDLAGSESVHKSARAAVGRDAAGQPLSHVDATPLVGKEGRSINLSLLYLEQVVLALQHRATVAAGAPPLRGPQPVEGWGRGAPPHANVTVRSHATARPRSNSGSGQGTAATGSADGESVLWGSSRPRLPRSHSQSSLATSAPVVPIDLHDPLLSPPPHFMHPAAEGSGVLDHPAAPQQRRGRAAAVPAPRPGGGAQRRLPLSSRPRAGSSDGKRPVPSAAAPHVYIPYRNSALTSVLRDSLGGNCKTVLIATLHPGESAVDASLATCRFAARCGGLPAPLLVPHVVPVVEATASVLPTAPCARDGPAAAAALLSDPLRGGKGVTALASAGDGGAGLGFLRPMHARLSIGSTASTAASVASSVPEAPLRGLMVSHPRVSLGAVSSTLTAAAGGSDAPHPSAGSPLYAGQCSAPSSTLGSGGAAAITGTSPCAAFTHDAATTARPQDAHTGAWAAFQLRHVPGGTAAAGSAAATQPCPSPSTLNALVPWMQDVPPASRASMGAAPADNEASPSASRRALATAALILQRLPRRPQGDALPPAATTLQLPTLLEAEGCLDFSRAAFHAAVQALADSRVAHMRDRDRLAAALDTCSALKSHLASELQRRHTRQLLLSPLTGTGTAAAPRSGSLNTSSASAIDGVAGLGFLSPTATVPRQPLLRVAPALSAPAAAEPTAAAAAVSEVASVGEALGVSPAAAPIMVDPEDEDAGEPGEVLQEGNNSSSPLHTPVAGSGGRVSLLSASLQRHAAVTDDGTGRGGSPAVSRAGSVPTDIPHGPTLLRPAAAGVENQPPMGTPPSKAELLQKIEAGSATGLSAFTDTTTAATITLPIKAKAGGRRVAISTPPRAPAPLDPAATIARLVALAPPSTAKAPPHTTARKRRPSGQQAALLSPAAFAVALLRAGSVFRKHGRRGRPHLRFVYWQDGPNLGSICWHDVGGGEEAGGRAPAAGVSSIPLSHIMSVAVGARTPVFDRFLRGASGETAAGTSHTCFSLLARARTLDLEVVGATTTAAAAAGLAFTLGAAASPLALESALLQQRRDDWVAALQYVLQARARGYA